MNNTQAGVGTLSVLVPVFNEEQTIVQVLRQVMALGPLLKEIVVVDDGSQDRTADLVSDLAAYHPVIRFFRSPVNRGKTAAIQHALYEATGDIIIIQDADLEYDPAEIPEVVAPILAGHADVVYGSRFLVRRASRVLYFYHYLANVTLTFLSNLLTNRNMTDIETCYKAFRAGVIKPLRLTSRGFGMEVEITALVSKCNARMYEVPISYYGRTYKELKKIALKNDLLAVYHSAYYNVSAPRMAAGRRYIDEANRFLVTCGQPVSPCAPSKRVSSIASRTVAFRRVHQT